MMRACCNLGFAKLGLIRARLRVRRALKWNARLTGKEQMPHCRLGRLLGHKAVAGRFTHLLVSLGSTGLSGSSLRWEEL